CAFFLSVLTPPPSSSLFPYTTLFRSVRVLARVCDQRILAADRLLDDSPADGHLAGDREVQRRERQILIRRAAVGAEAPHDAARRSEEHTSELQSLRHLVCRLLLEKKK